MNRDASLFPRNKIADGYLSFHNGGDHHLARHPCYADGDYIVVAASAVLPALALSVWTFQRPQLELLSSYILDGTRSGAAVCTVRIISETQREPL